MLNVVVTGTGPLLTLEEAKQHLRVDHSDDDTLIEAYSGAAVGQVLQYCNLALVPSTAGAVEAFKAAALLTLSSLYDSREDGSMPVAAERLVNPYRWLRV